MADNPEVMTRSAFAGTNQAEFNQPASIFICWKCATKHWGFTLRLFLSGFVLTDIPVLCKNSFLNAKNIGRDLVQQPNAPNLQISACQRSLCSVHLHRKSLCPFDNNQG